jgi:hypothetical protein
MEILVEVIGMKAFKGTIDGKAINSGCFYASVRLDERHNRDDSEGLNHKTGHAIEEWKVGDAELVKRVAHLKPSIKNPVIMRMDVERVSNGKETTEVVMDVRPVDAVAAIVRGNERPAAEKKAA